MTVVIVGKWMRAVVFASCVHGSVIHAQEPVAAKPVAANGERLIDTLNQASLQSAFQLLRQRYLEKESLTLDRLNRIALEGVLAQLGTGAELVPEKSHAESGSQLRMVSELISEDIAYVRPVTLSGGELKNFDSVLVGFQKSPARALILDLRCPGGTDQFRNAAEYCSRFVDSGAELFQILRPEGTGNPQMYKARKGQRWNKRLVVLVDGDTCPAGEILAASLRHQLGCLLVGSTTPGRTAEYEEVPIGKGGLLRYAVAEVIVVADQKLFGEGVVPDIRKELDLDEKRTMFLRAQSQGVHSFVTDVERARLNEAALVAGSNPELAARMEKNEGASEPEFRDEIIQAAVDVLTAALRMTDD
ncbi:MAG: hypothetical protein ACI9R3_002690 [Verrucomicrobiales bacterium]|jgi:hypothetical protein